MSDDLLNDLGLVALRHLRDFGALPESGYWRPTWAMQYESFDGRTLAGLVRRGLVIKMTPGSGAGHDVLAYQLTKAGLVVANDSEEGS